MKFQPGQTVIILNTEFKPAGTATICNSSEDLQQYEVDFKYPGSNQPEKIWLPVERLLSTENIPSDTALP